MQKLSFVLAGFLLAPSLPAFAESATSLANRFAVEFAATMSGSIGTNTRKDDNGESRYVSDCNLAIAARRFFSETLAFGITYDFGSEVTDGGRNIDDRLRAFGGSRVYLHPLVVGLRYESGSLSDFDTLRPYGEIGLGPTFAGSYSSSSAPRDSAVYFSARMSLGLDLFFTHSTRAYGSVRASYLAVDHDGLSSLQSTASLGYLF